MDKNRKITKIEGSLSLTIAYLIVMSFLLVLILFPLLCILFKPSLNDLISVFTTSTHLTAIKNTFIECICSTLCSVFIGYVYAYAIVKCNIPFRRFFAYIPLIHLITPPFVGGLSFILLFGRCGFITSTLLHLDVSLYGFWGLLVAQVLSFFPVSYMMCVQGLQGINPTYEQASRILGSSRLRIFFTITLPLSLPFIFSSALFIAVSVMSDFGNPMIVAGRYKVLAVEIYTQLVGWVKPGLSASLGIVLIIPSIILFVSQNIMARKTLLMTSTLGGKVAKTEGVKQSLKVRIPITIFVAFISLCIIAQFASLVAGSFQKLWGINTEFTLNHIKNLSRYVVELRNSIGFSLIGAAISTTIACLSSYMVYRTEVPFKKSIDILCQLPSSVPGSLYGLAYSLCAAFLNFHNSPVLIVSVIAIGFLPFSYRLMAASFSQVSFNLDNGARSLGANRMVVLSTVLLPITKNSVIDSFIYDFVRGVGTMSAVIFLVSFETPLASIKILNLAEEGFWGDAASLALLLTIITFSIIGLSKLIMSKVSK